MLMLLWERELVENWFKWRSPLSLPSLTLFHYQVLSGASIYSISFSTQLLNPIRYRSKCTFDILKTTFKIYAYAFMKKVSNTNTLYIISLTSFSLRTMLGTIPRTVNVITANPLTAFHVLWTIAYIIRKNSIRC